MLCVQIEGCQRRLKGLDAAEERARELQAQVFQERHALQDCRLALQQEQERAGKVATARELQGVISNLQEERKSAQVRLAKQSEQEQRVASAVSDAHAAEAKVKVRSTSGWIGSVARPGITVLRTALQMDT